MLITIQKGFFEELIPKVCLRDGGTFACQELRKKK